jgi:hypothetical protein
MNLRLLLDEDVHLGLAAALRKRGYDVVHVGEKGRLGGSDNAQFEYALKTNRCFVTFNVGDFVQLHNRWMEAGLEHHGIVVSRQVPIGEALRRLLVLLNAQNASSIRGQLLFL